MADLICPYILSENSLHLDRVLDQIGQSLADDLLVLEIASLDHFDMLGTSAVVDGRGHTEISREDRGLPTEAAAEGDGLQAGVVAHIRQEAAIAPDIGHRVGLAFLAL